MLTKKQKQRESEILLHLAIRNHRVEEVRQRLLGGADPNACDDRSLATGNPYALNALSVAVQAAAYAASAIRAALAEADRDLFPGAPPADLKAERARGVRIIRLLLEAGADPNRRSLTRTPLSIAVMTGDSELVKLLLDAGADPSGPSWSPTSRGRHAKGGVGLYANCIHHAAQKGFVDIIRILCERGADVTARNHVGKTALQLALKCRQSEAADMLRGYGSRPA